MRAKNNTSKIEPRVNLKIVFFGTPDFAAQCLEFLLEHHVDIVAVVTQPDRPQGRSSQVIPSDVKRLTLKKKPHIPIFQPEKASDPKFLEEIAKLRVDLFVVVVFGQILPQKLLDIPPLGSINVHPSLLPKFRGAAPIRRALMEGELETGVVIQKIVRQMDAGNLLAAAKMPISPDMTHGELEALLLELSKPLLLGVIRQYEKGVPQGTAQDHEKATYASKINSEEGEIHWDLPAQKIHNLIRALSPKPGAWVWIKDRPEITAPLVEGKSHSSLDNFPSTSGAVISGRSLKGKRLKILRSTLAQGRGQPGELLSSNGIVACGEGAIQLLEVQPEGKKAMSAADWLRGMPKDTKIFI